VSMSILDQSEKHYQLPTMSKIVTVHGKSPFNFSRFGVCVCVLRPTHENKFKLSAPAKSRLTHVGRLSR
jgi:hypothetical protein